jgi:hypothetical protein
LDGPDGLPAKVLDLDMLVLATGRERTEAEFAALLGSQLTLGHPERFAKGC